MELKNEKIFALFFMCTCLLTNGVTQNVNDGMTGNEQELRTLLNAVREQNRKLVLQNQRLQQVWFGMQQMCEALAMTKCDLNQTEGMVSSVNSSNKMHENENHNKTIADNEALPLEVLSVRSTGSVSNVTKISIKYIAPLEHFVFWVGSRYDDRQIRKGDTKSQTAPGSDIYTSTVDIDDIWSVRSLFFTLHNEEQLISIQLNLTAAETPGEQNVTAPYSVLIDVNTTYTAPQNSDLTITAVINLNKTYVGEFFSADIFLSGLNTSANPPTFFELYGVEYGAISLNLTERTKETTNCQITLRHHFIKYGGFLSIQLPYIESSKDRMIEEFRHGPFVKIYAYGTNEVIPYNTVGTLPLRNQTYIFSPSQSITCLAIGNPRPNATILKMDGNGLYSKVPTESEYSDKYSNQEILFLPADKRTSEGLYVCRASNGVKTVETFTEAVTVKEVVIDESRTGVVKNTSKTIIISCKAKGKPRPEVDFRLYTENGPFMIKSRLFKFQKSTLGKYASRVTLILSAVKDADVHTVYCFAAQGDRYRSIERTRKINIFPEGRDINWDLYYLVQDAQVF